MEAGESFVNYSSIEDSIYGVEVLEELFGKGFVYKYYDKKDVCSRLGGKMPILSKLALITTIKDGVLKHRLILDCRISGVNDAAIKVERILLPSAWDVIHDTLSMHAKIIPKAGEVMKYLVCDFKDAFFMLPLWAAECIYGGTLFRGVVLHLAADPSGIDQWASV